jgi:Uma2 family endonuclease
MPVHETLISVEEYLNTSYEGADREYLDGRVVERNLGEQDHSWLQVVLSAFFYNQRETLGTYPFSEQRLQVKTTRFRIPDVCVVLGGRPKEQIFRTPPFLAIEILSKDDRASDLQQKLDDYREFGIPYVWVIDPRTKSGVTHDFQNGQHSVASGLHTKNPDIDLPAGRLFE